MCETTLKIVYYRAALMIFAIPGAFQVLFRIVHSYEIYPWGPVEKWNEIRNLIDFQELQSALIAVKSKLQLYFYL